jgi:SAM-dependent methyltransferase
MQEHWEKVYRDKAADAVSWYRPHLELSLALLEDTGLSAASRVLDVGGGASTLVDDLVARGVAAVTVLDLSAAALAVARRRVNASSVCWLAVDIVDAPLPAGGFTHWHDRAVLHFLPDATDYARQAAHALAPGGFAVIGGFAPDGPERCSGLPVTRRAAAQIAAALGPAFELLGERREVHLTPWGSEQAFQYAVLRRR